MTFGHLVQSVENTKSARIQIFLHRCSTLALGEVAFRPVFAGQEPTCKRVVRDYPEPVFLTHRLKIVLIAGTVVQVVLRLQRQVACEAFFFADLKCFGQPLSTVIRSSNGANFALLYEIVEGAQRFRQRRLWIVPVSLVKIDIIRLQSP